MPKPVCTPCLWKRVILGLVVDGEETRVLTSLSHTVSVNL